MGATLNLILVVSSCYLDGCSSRACEVHPIERLRYVARADGAGPSVLGREAAGALAAFGDDPPALVTACRGSSIAIPPSARCGGSRRGAGRRRPGATRGGRPRSSRTTPRRSVLRRVAARRRRRARPRLARAGRRRAAPARATSRCSWSTSAADWSGTGSPAAAQRGRRRHRRARRGPRRGGGRRDLVLLEASALGPDGFVADGGSRAAAAVARHAGVPVWVVAGVGRVLPGPLWEASGARMDDGETTRGTRTTRSCPSTWSTRSGPAPAHRMPGRADCQALTG